VPYGVKGGFFSFDRRTQDGQDGVGLRSALLGRETTHILSLRVLFIHLDWEWELELGQHIWRCLLEPFFLPDFLKFQSIPTRCYISTFRCCFFVFVFLQMVLHFIFILFLWKKGTREYERMGTYIHTLRN